MSEDRLLIDCLFRLMRELISLQESMKKLLTSSVVEQKSLIDVYRLVLEDCLEREKYFYLLYMHFR